MDDEERRNWRLILTPAGEEWSGRTRYAAAMCFYKRGEMSAEVLEIYRICSSIPAGLRLDRQGREDAGGARLIGGAVPGEKGRNPPARGLPRNVLSAILTERTFKTNAR